MENNKMCKKIEKRNAVCMSINILRLQTNINCSKNYLLFRDITLCLLWLFLSPMVLCTSVTKVAITVFFSAEYPPEDGRKTPKPVAGLTNVCFIVSNYGATVGMCGAAYQNSALMPPFQYQYHDVICRRKDAPPLDA